MDTREKLNEFAELRGWNKNKLIGWSEAADFGDWLVKNCFILEVRKRAFKRGYEKGFTDGQINESNFDYSRTH